MYLHNHLCFGETDHQEVIHQPLQERKCNMIKLITRNLKTLEVIKEATVTDNWWDVYLANARQDGRRVIYHSASSYSVIYTEKNKVFTFVR
jgi:hypothetical protein